MAMTLEARGQRHSACHLARTMHNEVGQSPVLASQLADDAGGSDWSS